MADLVIKPAPSTGNKLILQTQNGTAALTTSDAGVDSATSIVATKTGTETLTNKTLTAPTVADMSNCTFPAGHVIGVYYEESDAQAQSFGTGSGVNYWNELDLSIPASSTSDYLVVTLTINGLMTEDANAYLSIGLAYSADSWNTIAQFGSVEYYNKHGMDTDEEGPFVTSSTIVVRANHPTSLAYKIRPKLLPVTNTIDVNWNSSVSTILAMSVKG